jgi:hypothetical protein
MKTSGHVENTSETKGSSSTATRLNLNLGESARQKLDKLCEKRGYSITQVVKRGLDLAWLMDECGDRGDRVVIISKDGSTRELLMTHF